MEQKEDAKAISAEILLNSQIANTYTNGFIINTTQADAIIIFLLNNKPTQIMNLSLTSAKTLSKKLAQIIEGFEKKTGVTINTIDDFKKKLGDNG